MEIPKPNLQRIYERIDMKQLIADQLARIAVVSCDTDGEPVQASIQYYRSGEDV